MVAPAGRADRALLLGGGGRSEQRWHHVKALPTESLLDTMYNTFMSTMMTSKPVLIGLTKSTLKDRSINIIYAVRLACVTLLQDGLPSYWASSSEDDDG